MAVREIKFGGWTDEKAHVLPLVRALPLQACSIVCIRFDTYGVNRLHTILQACNGKWRTIEVMYALFLAPGDSI